MRGQGHFRIANLALELAPAALLNFAVAFAVATLFRQNGLDEYAAAASVCAGIAAFLTAWYLLRRADRAARGFLLPRFEGSEAAMQPAGIIDDKPDLLLTDEVGSDRAEEQPAAGELLLDDIVASIGPDSRVVQLFDPQRMSTAGELQARIDRHLLTGALRPVTPDATQALHEAIDELRRSLR